MPGDREPAFRRPEHKTSDSEIIRPQFRVVENVAGIAGEHDLAHVEDDGTVGELQRGDGVLLDNDGGDALSLDAGDDRLDFARRSSGTSCTPAWAAW
jgi:hypothetical protein